MVGRRQAVEHDRRSIRLPGYDYTQPGAYVVTMVTHGSADRFGVINGGEVVLSSAGEMLRTEWLALAYRFPAIELDEFVIMPNHFHGILMISRAGMNPAPTDLRAPSLGDVIGAFKSITTHEYILGVKTNHWPPFDRRLWQRNYYEHVIRSDADLERVRDYIHSNPLRWELDREHPERIDL